ncbi:MAG: hypothetical protein AAF366_12545 [Pseudomonadota bacterium]
MNDIPPKDPMVSFVLRLSATRHGENPVGVLHCLDLDQQVSVASWEALRAEIDQAMARVGTARGE